MNTRSLLVAAVLFLAVDASAKVAPAVPFQDNTVLQQGRPVPVWGLADPGEKITVTYASPALTRSASATADSAGRWLATLPSLPASTEPATLAFAGAGAGADTVTRANILVGEVWLASGQSNMAWALGWGNRITNAKEEIAAANFPLIRELTVKPAAADEPQTSAAAYWRVCTPGNVANFSAAAYFFARDLHRRLGVPVGIINASWGGSAIEPFMTRASLENTPEGPSVLAKWKEKTAGYPEAKARYDQELAAWRAAKIAAEKAGEKFTAKQPATPPGPGHQSTPVGSYNAMIHPFVPYAIRGVIWYQGETNVGGHVRYRDSFPALIAGWREVFQQPDLPFFWVQLAAYAPNGDASGNAFAWLRDAQDRTLSVPGTGQALAIDIGDRDDIHPANKQDVGLRLARLALHRVYGQADVVDSGPVLSKAEFSAGEIRLHFSGIAGGLKNTNAAGDLLGFEVAGSDKNFLPAKARIDNAAEGLVVVETPASVAAPVFVRYAFRNFPANSLANGEGLPAAPFRTDP